MYSFATAPIKLKPGHQIGGGLLIANHLDQSLWCANLKHWVAVGSKRSCALYQPRGTCTIMLRTKPFSWAKPACVGFSSSNFTVQSHIPSTSGDGLTSFEVSENLVHHCWWMGHEWIFLIATNHGHIPWFYFTKLSFIFDEMVLHMITITHVHCLCNACPIACNAHLTTQSQCKMTPFQICLC
jgi:hypothetical protein